MGKGDFPTDGAGMTEYPHTNKKKNLDTELTFLSLSPSLPAPPRTHAHTQF